jgi:glycosyltransferase involved in cell wall biosynthesis
MPERPRILQMGPDPAIGGGMAAALRGLLESPLAERYELEVVPTYRGAEPLARLAVYCAALGRLVAWSLRGRGQIVHVHATVRGSMYRKAVCVLLGKALRRRVVLHVHSGAGDIAQFAQSRGALSLRLFRAALGAADAVLAVSAASAEALRHAYGVAEIAVVPNAAPVVAPFVREPAPPDEVRVAYLGGFANPAKGGDVMLAALDLALAREPRLRVTMAGPGELPPRGAELLAARPALEWAGWLTPAEKDALLRRAEVFVMPSRSEGLPMALLEAMAHGMAVVATAVGGIPEVVDPGVDGLLAPSEDPAALADALCELAADPVLRERLGAGARRRVETLDAVEVAGRLDALYASLS